MSPEVGIFVNTALRTYGLWSLSPLLIMTFSMLETVMLLACSTITLGRMVRRNELSRKQMVVTCMHALLTSQP